MKIRSLQVLVSWSLLVGLAASSRADVVAGFDDLTLAPNSANGGPMPGSTSAPGSWGSTVWTGSFTSQGAQFSNRFADYGSNGTSWSGFAYSNQTDTTTPGFGNQYSTYAGEAHSGDNFGVASGYRDVASFDPTDLADLEGLPSLALPFGASIEGVFVTNTTYAALSMLNGDSFAKAFGGDTGNDPDWFKVTAYGADALGNVLAASVEFYLADFRFADNAQDYILDDWAYMNLSSLAGASRIFFNLSSSDVGAYGMNTPAYFALDDVTYRINQGAAVPEPASLATAGLAAGLIGLALRRRRAG